MSYINTLAEVKERISYLKTLKSVLVGTDKPTSVKKVIKAEKLRISNEIEFLGSEKTWNFNFQSGGWNTIRAKSKDVAIKRASKKYNCKVSKVDTNTFRVATEEDTKVLMSLFY
jgi:hypothetical protein